jgi:hypothetical protein
MFKTAKTLFFLSVIFISTYSFAQTAENNSTPATNTVAPTPINNNNETPVAENSDKKEQKDEKTVVKEYKIFDGENASTLNTDIKSLMFEEDFLKNIYSRILYKASSDAPPPVTSNIVVDTPAVESNNATTTPANVTLKAFYLSSVIYNSDNDSWTAWINKNKIRSYSPYIDGLHITDVKKNYIVASFTSENIKFLNDSIRKNLIPTGDKYWDYASEKGDVKLNSNLKLVEFRMRTGQTFSEYHMAVVEGIVAATEIDTATNQPLNPTTGNGGTEEISNAIDETKSEQILNPGGSNVNLPAPVVLKEQPATPVEPVAEPKPEALQEGEKKN